MINLRGVLNNHFAAVSGVSVLAVCGFLIRFSMALMVYSRSFTLSTPLYRAAPASHIVVSMSHSSLASAMLALATRPVLFFSSFCSFLRFCSSVTFAAKVVSVSASYL